MFCPHCGQFSLSSRCSHCRLPSISAGRLFVRRRGWWRLLLRIGGFATFISLVTLLLTGALWGMALGWVVGGLLAAAFSVLSRERAYDR